MKYNGMERSRIAWSGMSGAEWNKYFIPLFEYFKREMNKIEGR
jgi:hypothetical protein